MPDQANAIFTEDYNTCKAYAWLIIAFASSALWCKVKNKLCVEQHTYIAQVL